jgi:hypothetical protein
MALCDVGKCAYYLDDYSGGKRSLNDGIKLALSIGDKEGEAWCRFHLGDLRILQGEYLKAEVSAQKNQQKIALLQQAKNHEAQRNQIFIWLGSIGLFVFGVIIWVLAARNKLK